MLQKWSIKPVSTNLCISMSLEFNTNVLAFARFVGKGERTLVKHQRCCPYAHFGGTGWRHNTYQPSVGLTLDPVITLTRWEKKAAQHAQPDCSFAPVSPKIAKIIRWGKQTMAVLTIRQSTRNKLGCNKKKTHSEILIIHQTAVNLW